MSAVRAYNQVTDAVIEELRHIVGEKHVFTEKERMEEYSHDEVTDTRYQPTSISSLSFPAGREPVLLPELRLQSAALSF